LITGGRIPPIKEMTTDEYGLRSMCYIDAKDLVMSSTMWGKQLHQAKENLARDSQGMGRAAPVPRARKIPRK
jgi:hypothetical protein